MDWFTFFMIAAGIVFLWLGGALLLSKSFFVNLSEEEVSTERTENQYWYKRYLTAFDFIANGFIFFSFGIGVATHNILPAVSTFFLFAFMPTVGTFFVVAGILLFFSENARSWVWKRLWFAETIEEDNKLLAIHLLTCGVFLLSMLYAVAYMEGLVPQIGR